jgi:hypothetical protein
MKRKPLQMRHPSNPKVDPYAVSCVRTTVPMHHALSNRLRNALLMVAESNQAWPLNRRR